MTSAHETIASMLKPIDDRVRVLGQERPRWIGLTIACDAVLDVIHAPQLVDSLLLVIGLVLMIGFALGW